MYQPLTSMQSEIYFDQSRQPEQPYYNVGVIIETNVRIEHAALQQAVNLLASRIETLSMRLSLNEDGECVQSLVLGDSIPISLHSRVESSQSDTSEAKANAKQAIDQFYSEPFDLIEDQLFVIQHYEFAPSQHWIILKSHHILADGYAMADFTRLLGLAYHEVITGQQDDAMHKIGRFSSEIERHQAYLSSAKFDKDWQFWLRKLEDLPPLLFDGYHSKSPQAHHLRSNLSDESVAQLRLLAEHTGTSLQHIGLAALSIYFAHAHNRDDMLIAVPVHRRKNHHQKHMLGTMASDIPCRLTPDSHLSLEDYLSQIAGELRSNYRHTDFPLAQLLREAELLQNQQSTLTDVVFNYELRGKNYLFEGEEITAHYLFSGAEQAALHVRLIDFGDMQPLGIYLSAQQGLMTELEAELLASRLKHILEQFSVAACQQEISSFSILPMSERDALLSDFAGDTRNYGGAKTLNQRFEQQASVSPNAIAVTNDDKALSYRELNQAANRIAHTLLERGVAKGEIVGLYAKRDVGFLAAMLAIWKVGAVYVPLDPKNPVERINYMLEQSEPSIVVCDQGTADKLPSRYQNRILRLLDRCDPTVVSDRDRGLANPANCNSADDPAYLIYTSGSTGQPKGAVVHHGGAVHHIDAMFDVLGLGDAEDQSPLTMLQSASSSSDISVWQFVAPVLSGGKTVIFEDISDVDKLLQTLRSQQVELIECVPVVIRLLLDHIATDAQNSEALSNLKWLMTTGDAISSALANDWFRIAGRIPLLNAYGPSETADDVSVQIISAPLDNLDGNVPIGKPLANTSIHIVDQLNRLMPIGVVGELCISGLCVGHGYWNDPEKTAEKFVKNPFTGYPGVHGDVMYRSGDLAKWNTNGELVFIGRTDNQVQVRGYRVELGEVEAGLAAHHSVGDVAVVQELNAGVDARLLAYVTEKAECKLDMDELKHFAASKMPDHMVPSLFYLLPVMPRNSADKIDRKALQLCETEQYEPSDSPDVSLVLSNTETNLALVWSDLLKIPTSRISANADFFNLGGHSLTAVRLVAAIRSQWQIDIEIRHIFASPKLEELARFIESRDSQANTTIEPAPENSPIPLSYAQQRIWFIDQFEPGGSEYNASVSIRLKGALNIPALNKAFADLLQRHSVLRTTYVSDSDRELQLVGDVPESIVQHINLPAGARIDQDQELNDLLAHYTDMPFDLSKDSMVRCVVLQASETQAILIMTVHHIASDGWSQGIMMRELSLLYTKYANSLDNTDAELPTLSIQYKDYAYWQRQNLVGESLNQHLEYWRAHLHGMPTVHNFPLDYPRPALQSHAGGLLTTHIASEKLVAMHHMMEADQLTLFMVLKAVFTSLLHRYSGDEDIVIGSPVANREQAEIEPLVGFFVNTLVYRTQFDNELTFADLLSQCKRHALDGYAHQQMPFELLVDALQPTRSSSYNPLFQIMLTLENNDIGDWTLPGIDTELIEPESIASQFDLSLDAREDSDGLTLTWSYAKDLFKPDTIERLAAHFERLLITLCENPEQKVGQADLLNESEREQLLVNFNDTHRPDLISTPWTVLFERQAKLSPERTAAVYLDQSISYAELERRSGRIAQALHSRDIHEDSIVAVLCERNLDLLILVVGVLRAGAAYLPLDPSHPLDRTQKTLAQALPSLVLTGSLSNHSTLAYPLEALSSQTASLLTLESNTDYVDSVIEAPGLDCLAYLISTSGSTGTPKGVMVNHRGMVNNMLAKIAPLKLKPSDVIGQTASQCFDISVWQFLTALAIGATTDIVPTCVTQDPDALLVHLRTHRINVWEPVPSMIRAILSNPCDLPELRCVLPTGEALTPDLVKHWFEQYPDIPLINAYGPAECSDDVTMELIESPVDKVFIGTPVPNARVHLVDTQQQLVPIGVVGEIAISGPVVGRGYVNAPDLTREVFIPNPHARHSLDQRLYLTGDLGRRDKHGKIEYLGRKDHQVKIRGLRIELDDIASALRKIEQVDDAAVVVNSKADQQQNLVAIVVPKKDLEGSAAMLKNEYIRRRLIEFLPSYMIPDQTVVIDALPLNSNGKVDRNKLAELVPECTAIGRAPLGQTEIQLAQIWSSLLGAELNALRADSDFFSMGGHSLLGIRLVTLIDKAFSVTLPVRDIFDHRDIQTMSAQIDLLISQRTTLESMQALADSEIEEVEF